MKKFRIIDPKLDHHVGRYAFQCLLATLVILVVLLFLDIVEHTALIATLGASVFIVFTMPKAYSSGMRPLLGGYLVGITVGCSGSILGQFPEITSVFPSVRAAHIVFGAFAVGIAIFLMTVTNTEHPPAAGMALGLVLNQWDYTTIIFIFGAVGLLALSKKMLKPVLIDLM